MTAVTAAPQSRTSFRGFSAAIILLLGVVVVPMVLVFAFNSWDAPDAAAYVRMAFAQVAAATIAIVTVLSLLVSRVIRRARWSTIVLFAVIALMVTSMQASAIGRSSDFLLNGLAHLG